MKNFAWIVGLLMCCTTVVVGQSVDLYKSVTVHYSNVRLEDVLVDISQKHRVQFSYSSYYVPVDKKVTAHIENQPLMVALDEVFADTKIVYATIAGQIVLKVDKNKPIRGLSHRETKEQPMLVVNPMVEQREKAPEFPPIERRERSSTLKSGQSTIYEPIDLEAFKDLFPVLEAEEKKLEDFTRLAQVSVWPAIGTNAGYSEEITNKLSFNVFWGMNGGVDGVEVGGFVNSIKNDVEGVQAAGLGNVVQGNVTGSQIGGLFNKVGGTTVGVQVGGLFNISHETSAIQGAGLANIVKGDFGGVQVGGLFNIVTGSSSGTQAAGLFNITHEDGNTQLSGLFNIADDVDGQLAGFFNRAKKVGGFQIGIINVADTVGGATIGLLNFVKNGYNKVEISGGDLLKANLGFKFGSPAFYNIIHLGSYVSDESWGLGYGVGTAITMNPRWLLNLEAVAIHLNEGELWTSDLNLLNQFRFTVDCRLSRHVNLFLGLSANVLVSRLRNSEDQLIGSQLVPYTLFEYNDSDKTNIKMWAGFNVGLRF